MTIRRALAISAAGKYSSFAIQFVATVVLARLLTPAEIGVFSVAAALAGFAQILRDFGVASFLIQERELTAARIRAALAVAYGIAWTFAAVLAGVAPLAARFYGEPGLADVLWIVAGTFVILPVSSTILPVLRREMRFGTLLAINTASALIHAVTAIALAASGFGFMSLAWAGLAGVAATAGLAVVARRGTAHFVPGFAEVRRVLAFGSVVSATTLLRELNWRTPELIWGRMLGFEAVGLYSRATGLLSILSRLVIEAAQPVALPALADKLRRGEDVTAPCRRAFAYWSALWSSFLMVLAIMAEPAVLLLYGDQWLGAVPLIQIFALPRILLPDIDPILGPLLIATGRVRKALRIELIVVPVTVALVSLGALHSLTVAAVGLVMARLFRMAVTYRIFLSVTGVRLAAILRVAARTWAVTAAAAVPVALARWAGEAYGLPAVAQLAAAGVGGSAVWLAAVFVVRHPIREEATLALAHMSGLVARRKPT